MSQDTLDVAGISSRIHSLKLQWIAQENELTKLSEVQRKVRLGATPPPGVRTLQEREQVAATQAHAAGAFPAAYDARTAGWVTPIEDQGGCGSCVAFGTTAAVESSVRIANNNPKLSVDLSEAQVF